MLVLSLCILFTGLLYLSFVDVKHRLVPIRETYFLIVTGLFFGTITTSFHDSVVGASIGCALPLFARETSIVFSGKEGMGDGDASVLSAVGAFLGWQGAVFTFFSSAVLGLLFSIVFRKKSIPLVPFLTAGAFLYVPLKPIIDSYLSVFSIL